MLRDPHHVGTANVDTIQTWVRLGHGISLAQPFARVNAAFQYRVMCCSRCLVSGLCLEPFVYTLRIFPSLDHGVPANGFSALAAIVEQQCASAGQKTQRSCLVHADSCILDTSNTCYWALVSMSAFTQAALTVCVAALLSAHSLQAQSVLDWAGLTGQLALQKGDVSLQNPVHPLPLRLPPLHI